MSRAPTYAKPLDQAFPVHEAPGLLCAPAGNMETTCPFVDSTSTH